MKIRDEAEDIDGREAALMATEIQKVKREIKAAKSQMEAVLQEFENQLRTSADQVTSLINKSESAIASIVEAHCPNDVFSTREAGDSSYTPQIGDQVHVEGLRNKLATVIEAPGDEGTVLVQCGKVRVRVNRSTITARKSSKVVAAKSSAPPLKRKVWI